MFRLLFLPALSVALSTDLKLELVQVLFRHGARTNSKMEINIAMPQGVDTSLHEANGHDQLTKYGKAQAYDLGCVLRDRYNEFLGPLYKSEDLYAYSSDFDRTKMSLQLVLAGLYPPVSSEQIWNENLKWQPIPLNYVSRPTDVLLRAFDMPKYVSLLEARKKTPSYTNPEKELKYLGDIFESNGIDSIKKLGLMATAGILNIIMSHKASNGKLPDWFTDDLIEKVKRYGYIYFDMMASTPELIKWQVGPLTKQFLDNIEANEKTEKRRKIYLYSGHDFNIIAYTRVHQRTEAFWYPDFSSAIILETFKDSENRLYMRLVAWPRVNGTFLTLKIGNCNEFCPMEEYVKIVEDIIPSEKEIDSMIG